MESGGLASGGPGHDTPSFGSNSGGIFTDGPLDEWKLMIVVLSSIPALVAPLDLFVPSTVIVAKPWALPVPVRLTAPPRPLDTATFDADIPPRWLVTFEAVASTRMAAGTAA